MWSHFLCLPLLLVAANGCGEVSPRAEVVCYHNGDAHLASLDACKCTILTANNLELNADLKVTSKTDFTKLRDLKKTNPELKLVGSLGGSNVKAETFSRVTSSVEGVANFTEGLISFVAANELDGIEIDWRWPGQHGGRKDIDDVSTLMKVVRLALDQRVHSVSRRDVDEITTETPEDPATDATETVPTTETTTQQTTEAELLTEASTEASTEATTETSSSSTTAAQEATTTTEDAASSQQLFEDLATEAPQATTGSFLDYFGSFFGDYLSDYLASEDYSNDYAEYYDDSDYDAAAVSAGTTTLPEIENLGSDYLVLESGSEYEVTVRPTQPEVRPKVKVFRTKEKDDSQGVVSRSSSTVKPYRGSVKFSVSHKIQSFKGDIPERGSGRDLLTLD